MVANARIRRVVVSGAAMALAIGAIGVGSPAQASVAQGYIAGAGVLTDDWGDEGTISATTRNHSNAVWLWQVVLIADGYLTSIDDIDCRFGERTTAATIRWQRARGLEADGKVGPNTFGRADNNLFWYGTEIRYNGSVLDVEALSRDSSGYYTFGSDKASYTSASAC
jgi:peptidoglycan hydrolase-like protein with peptidoglycan-binding domain